MKTIGVRFCGGCNPRYDRGAAFRRIDAALKEEESGIMLEHAAEGTVYDGLLVIGGCQACCAGYQQFSNRGPVLKLYTEDAVPEMIDRLAKTE